MVSTTGAHRAHWCNLSTKILLDLCIGLGAATIVSEVLHSTFEVLELSTSRSVAET